MEIQKDDHNLALMVDMQNDFINALADKGWNACKEAELLLANVDFDIIMATQDWHPQSHISFVENHDGAEPMDVIETDQGEQKLWPQHCIQETPGAALDTALERFPDVIFRKGKHHNHEAYSVFDEPRTERAVRSIIGAHLFGDTIRTLTSFDNKLTNIFLFGVATDVCVLQTGLDLKKTIGNYPILDKSLNLFFVEDCSAGISEEDTKDAKEQLKEAGYEFVNRKQCMEELRWT